MLPNNYIIDLRYIIFFFQGSRSLVMKSIYGLPDYKAEQTTTLKFKLKVQREFIMITRRFEVLCMKCVCVRVCVYKDTALF